MSYKLFNGLIEIGGILTETYYRKTKATDEAIEDLGLDAENKPNAAIGIASVDEFVHKYLNVVKDGDPLLLNDAITDQPAVLETLYTGNPNQDKFTLEMEDYYGNVVYTQRFSRTQQISIMPKLTIPVGFKLYVKDTELTTPCMATFRLCSLIKPTVEEEVAT